MRPILRRTLLAAGALAVLALGGCATSSPSPAGAAGAPPRVTLAAEQRRFADLFRGTPVEFILQRDGALRVVVPVRDSYEKGRYAVRPPLAAVLDRLARSQRLEPTRFFVAAPVDPQAKGLLLATERAASTRDYLVARGIDATRFTLNALSSGDAVVIVIADPAEH